MPFDLEAEIARRLNVSRDAVAPVLGAVVERIRQQVSHYGYARMAGLGTFRRQDGHLTFEPDSVLSDEVNVRFAGLEELQVAAAARSEEEGLETAAYEEEDEARFGESPGDDYKRSDSGLDDEEVYREVENADQYVSSPAGISESEVELEPGMHPGPELAEEGSQESAPWEDEIRETEPREVDAPGVIWAEGSDEPVEDVFASDSEGVWDDEPVEADDDEGDDAVTWVARPEEDHPLGPVPEPPFEEADYSVLEDQRATAQESEHEQDTYAGDRLEDEFEAQPEFPDEDMLGDDVDVDSGSDVFIESEADVPRAEDEYFAGDFSEPAGAEGHSVEWSTHDEEHERDLHPEEEEEEADAEFEAAAAGSGNGIELDPSHEKAPDRAALPHERIRQQPPRRHAAARATGGGAAGGNRNAIWIGVGVLVLVAAAAVVYFVLSPPQTPDEPAITEGRETQVPVDTSTAAASADAGDADTTAAAAPPVPTFQEEAPDPLRSADGIDLSAGGFTLIVYSETSQSGADNVATRFRNDGFRTSVLEDQESGRTRYRVGVGQFTTLEEAAEARDRLAGNELPEDAWVRRVR